MKDAALDKDPQSIIFGSTPKSVDFNERRRIGQGPSIDNLGQPQSEWILMKDAALDKDPQSIIFKVFIAVG